CVTDPREGLSARRDTDVLFPSGQVAHRRVQSVVGRAVVSASQASSGVTPLMRTRLALLGGFSLSRGGEELRLPGSAQRLVAFLALQERPVPRRRIAFTLWPDASERHANGSLRAALFRLRSGCRDGILAEGIDLGLD